MNVGLVMLGAALGAALRWRLDWSVSRRWPGPLPWATLSINVLGSFALSLVVGLFAAGAVSASAVALLGTGVCGGFTTFSTFAFEVVDLARRGRWAGAAAYVALSVGLSLVAAAAGWSLASAIA